MRYVARIAFRLLPLGGLAMVAAVSCRDDGPRTDTPAPGQVVWRSGQFEGTARPGVDSTTVFTLASDRVVRAYDKTSGALVWVRQLPDSGWPGNDVLAADSRVLVDGVDLYGLDAKTGAIAWRFQPTAGAGTGYFFMSASAGHVYVGARQGRGYLYSANVLSGAQEWIASVYADDSTRVYDPTVTDGVVYVRFSVWRANGVHLGGAAAVDASSGQLLWSTLLPAAQNPAAATNTWSIAVAASVVAVSANDGRVFGIDRGTGAIVWTVAPFVYPPGSTFQNPQADIRALAILGSTVFIGSTSGYVTAVRASDGSQQWQTTAGLGSTGFALAVDQSAVYVLYWGGQVAALDLSTGAEKWRNSASFVMARFSGDRLYGAGTKGVAAIRIR